MLTPSEDPENGDKIYRIKRMIPPGKCRYFYSNPNYKFIDFMCFREENSLPRRMKRVAEEMEEYDAKILVDDALEKQKTPRRGRIGAAQHQHMQSCPPLPLSLNWQWW